MSNEILKSGRSKHIMTFYLFSMDIFLFISYQFWDINFYLKRSLQLSWDQTQMIILVFKCLHSLYDFPFD